MTTHGENLGSRKVEPENAEPAIVAIEGEQFDAAFGPYLVWQDFRTRLS